MTGGLPSFQDCKNCLSRWLIVSRRMPFLSMLSIARLETSTSASSSSKVLLSYDPHCFAHFFLANLNTKLPETDFFFRDNGDSDSQSEPTLSSCGESAGLQPWTHDPSSENEPHFLIFSRLVSRREQTHTLLALATQGSWLTLVKGEGTSG